MQFLTLSLFSMSAMATETTATTPKPFTKDPTCSEEKDFEPCKSVKVVGEDGKTENAGENLGKAGDLEYCWVSDAADKKGTAVKCPIAVAATWTDARVINSSNEKQTTGELEIAQLKCKQCKKSAAAYTGAFIGLLALLI